MNFAFVLRDAFNIAGGLWFSMRPGTHYLDQEEWLFSSIWLPQLREFDMKAKALLSVKLLIKEPTSYSDYREFQVNVNDSVTLPKKLRSANRMTDCPRDSNVILVYPLKGRMTAARIFALARRR